MTSENTTTTTRLAKHQQAIASAAAAALAAEHGHGIEPLARRIGILEWHLGEVLSLVRELAGSAKD